jgi:hypothetical protein
MENPNEIVGHKTFMDGRHEPLTRAEADALWESAKASEAKRAVAMPDVESALDTMTDAHTRLKELGWREAAYAPKNGTELELIEPGSSGNGKDGAGCFWIPDAGDEWPSHPILFRLPSSKGSS